MDEFFIPSVDRSGGLLFFERLPCDQTEPLSDFRVRVTDRDLCAATQVYAGYSSHPAQLFSEIAQLWSGWPGELTWKSLEDELSIYCTRDRFGHIAIRVALQSGFMADDWTVQATVMTEAGQLDKIARQAKQFFGREWEA